MKKVLIKAIMLTALMGGTVSTLAGCNNSQEEVVETKYSITCNEVSGVKVSLSKSEAKEGETVTISLNVTDSTKVLDKIEASNVTLEEVTKDKQYTFIMPKQDVVITVTLKDKPIELFNININKDEHVLSSTLLVNDKEVTNAKPGDKVTLKLTFETKYEVLDVKSEEVTIEEVTPNEEYTFVMPNKEVTIDITSLYIKESFKVNSLKTYALKGTTIKDVTGLEEGKLVLEGDEISLSFSATSDTFNYFVLVNNEKLAATLNSETKKYEVKFNIPTNDIDVTIISEYKALTEGVTITLTTNNELYDVYGVYDGLITSFPNYSYLYFYVVPKFGVMINSVKASIDGKTSTNIYNESSLKYCYYSAGAYNAKESIEITIDAEYVGEKTLTIINSENLIIEEIFDKFVPGEEVSLHVSGKGNYLINGIKEAKCEDASITFKPTYKSGILSFTMPKSNCSIEFNLVVAQELVLVNTPAITSYKFTIGGYQQNETTKAVPGEEVRFYHEIDPNYVINKYFVNGVETTKYSLDSYLKFTCPESENGKVEITVEASRLYSVSYETNAAYSLTGLPTKAVASGTKVSFALKENAGYKITGVKLSNDTVLTPDSTGYNYSFVMPEQDVSVIVTYETATAATITFNKSQAGIAALRFYGKYNKSLSSGDLVNSGDEVKFDLTLANGYSLTSLTLSDGTKINDLGNGSYSFVMPEVNVELVCELLEGSKSVITVNKSQEFINVYLKDDGYSTSEMSGYHGHKMSGSIEFKSANKAEYYYDESCLEIVTKSGTPFTDLVTTISSDKKVIKFEFTMPEEEVIFNISCKEVEKSAITFGDYLEVKANNVAIASGDKYLPGTRLRIGWNIPQESVSDEVFNANTWEVVIKETIGGTVLKTYKSSTRKDYFYFSDYSTHITIEIVSTPIA